MKKSFLLIMCAVALVLGFSSCGNPDAKITLNEDLKYLVDVLGDEDDFFEPVAGVYPVTEVDEKLQVTIEFEKSKNTSSNKYIAERFYFHPKDKDDEWIEYDNDLIEFHSENRQNALRDLLNAQVGDHVKVTFSYMPTDKTAKKELLGKIYSCSHITLDIERDEVENDDNERRRNDDDDEELDSDDEEDDDDETSSDNTSSTDWDAILYELENYVDKTIAVCNKVNNGDMSAMSEYSSLIQSSQELSSKLAQGQGSLTAAQVARYTKISTKMANAALKMK